MTPLEEALAVFYAADPERARRVLAEHVLDAAGRCPKCTGVGCSLRAAAERALALRARNGAR